MRKKNQIESGHTGWSRTMSQLMGYTRKILASAISSIADELEQTILDFNEAVHVLSSQQSTKLDNQSHSEAATTNSRLEHPPSTTADTGPRHTLPVPSEQDHVCREVIGRSHNVATTRQPEAIGFSPILNVRLSKSSPTLLPGATHHSVFHEKRKKSSSPARPCRTKSPTLDSAVSASSPCLVHATATSRLNHKPAPDSGRQGVNTSGSPVSEVITRGATSVNSAQADVTCARIQSNSVLNKIGQKQPGKVVLPGKVVRSQSLSQHGRPEAPLNYVHTRWSSCKVDTGTQTETESDGGALVLSTSHETEARITRWFSFRPFTQVLSFAFSQFANIVLMFSEEPQTGDATGPRLHRRQLSITFDNTQNDSATYDNTKNTDSYTAITIGISKEKSSLESPMLSSTYSCESFEIIESSSGERLSCSPQDGDSGGDKSFLSRLYSDTNATQTEGSVSNDFIRCGNRDSLTASAEFFQFNFKDLVSNRQFNKLNPIGGVTIYSSEIPNENSASEVKTASTMMLDAPSIRVEGAHDYPDNTMNSEIFEEKEDKDSEDNPDDDDDDDGSASFTVLSENGDEEFIVLEMNK